MCFLIVYNWKNDEKQDRNGVFYGSYELKLEYLKNVYWFGNDNGEKSLINRFWLKSNNFMWLSLSKRRYQYMNIIPITNFSKIVPKILSPLYRLGLPLVIGY